MIFSDFLACDCTKNVILDKFGPNRKKPYMPPSYTVYNPGKSACLMSHYLNNQLAIIMGQCELLAQRLEDPDAKKRLRTITKTVSRMTSEIQRQPCMAVQEGSA